MTKFWEYKFVSIGLDNKLNNKLNEYGKEGWELVGFISYTGSFKIHTIFKREVRNEPD